MTRILLISLAVALCGCSGLSLDSLGASKGKPAIDPLPDGIIRPQARPNGLSAEKPKENAVTVEDFDTTTDEQRMLAAEVPTLDAEELLGKTIASLGDPSKPGFWLETPLVSTGGTGRVFSEDSGNSAKVTLIPIDGPESGGSRISLSAMRLLAVPLTGLPTLEVYRDN